MLRCLMMRMPATNLMALAISDESSEPDDNEDPALAVKHVDPEVPNEVPPEPIVAAGRPPLFSTV